MSKTAYLFLNGEPPTEDDLAVIAKEVSGGEILSVCADGGFCYVKSHFLPDIIIGDFDSSIKKDIPSSIKTIELMPEKDFTDGHVATEYIINQGVSEIVIYGASGKRADHMLSNLSLLALASKNSVSAKIDSGDFLVMLVENNFAAKTKIGKIVSIIPYSDNVHVLETKGLKYPIYDKILDKIHILGISNVAESDEIECKILSGSALIFLQK